jgi:hypothetical protein
MNDSVPTNLSGELYEDSHTEELVMISNYAWTFKDRILRIGTGNYNYEKYTDDHGRRCKGWTAGLSLWTKDESLPWKNYTIYAGKEITYGPYQVKVLAFGKMHWYTFWTHMDRYSRMMVRKREKE